ncbi:MAG TPA: hypothetical protein VKX25_18255 [Bryobacteraceae bacterium]|jgi:hypothetical protein|nr:hypothetical protein [Bryobacteraceae bacterium]
MKKLLAACVFLLPCVLSAQQKRVYMDPNNPFTPTFSSALEKKKVPVTVTTDPDRADYTIQFHNGDNEGSLARGITSAITSGTWNTGAYNEVSMRVVDNKSKDVMFSYTCRKRNAMNPSETDMANSVAECLAKHWKDKLSKQ